MTKFSVPASFTTWLRDAAERVLWTAAECAVGLVSAKAAGLPPDAAVVAATLLAGVKAVVARHVGDPSSASLGGDAPAK